MGQQAVVSWQVRSGQGLGPGGATVQVATRRTGTTRITRITVRPLSPGSNPWPAADRLVSGPAGYPAHAASGREPPRSGPSRRAGWPKPCLPASLARGCLHPGTTATAVPVNAQYGQPCPTGWWARSVGRVGSVGGAAALANAPQMLIGRGEKRRERLFWVVCGHTSWLPSSGPAAGRADVKGPSPRPFRHGGILHGSTS